MKMQIGINIEILHEARATHLEDYGQANEGEIFNSWSERGQSTRFMHLKFSPNAEFQPSLDLGEIRLRWLSQHRTEMLFIDSRELGQILSSTDDELLTRWESYLEEISPAQRIPIAIAASAQSRRMHGEVRRFLVERLEEDYRLDRAGSAPPLKAIADSRKIFVVHGRNKLARDALFNFLRSIGLQPLEWGQALAASGKGAPFIGEVLDSAYSQVQAVVVLLTGDDLAMLVPSFQEPDDPETEKQPTPQARPNVLFEAGLAFGSHPRQTILVQLGPLRPFSDIGGRHMVRISNAAASRQDLANRLKVAGCSVDLSGSDWLSTGDFDGAISESTPAEALGKAQVQGNLDAKELPAARATEVLAPKESVERLREVYTSAIAPAAQFAYEYLYADFCTGDLKAEQGFICRLLQEYALPVRTEAKEKLDSLLSQPLTERELFHAVELAARAISDYMELAGFINSLGSLILGREGLHAMPHYKELSRRHWNLVAELERIRGRTDIGGIARLVLGNLRAFVPKL